MSTQGQRRALLLGATGLVGSKLLTQLIQHEDYRAIATLGRRAPALTHEKVSHFIDDFSGDSLHGPVPDADVLFCCLGTTIRQAGSQRAFRAIDHDLVVNIARQARENRIQSFIVVSSVGANADTGNFYLRTKGDMEQAVARMGYACCGIVRPSLLLGARHDLRPAEQIGQYAARLFNPLLPRSLAKYRAIDDATVAAAMIGLDQADCTGTRIIEGDEITNFAGS
jgi:uncharacterized protein YbjT (DUF2867 family)